MTETKTRVPPFRPGISFTNSEGALTKDGADALNLLRLRTGGSDDFVAEERIVSLMQQTVPSLVGENEGLLSFFFGVLERLDSLEGRNLVAETVETIANTLGINLSERIDALESQLVTASSDESIENGVGGLSSFVVNQLDNITTQVISATIWTIIAALVTDTGWTASTGTLTKGGLDSDSSTTASGTYVQAEVQAINDDVVEARRHIRALQAALTTTTLLGA